MFKRNDIVWYAGRESVVETVVCPECFGKKYLTVILGDDSRVTIDCAGCAAGFDPPQGYLTYRVQHVEVRQVTICYIEIGSDGIRYGFDQRPTSRSIAPDTDLFTTKPEAEVRALALAEEWNAKQLVELHRKKKNDRDWSWHVHYYRKMIRDAERTIEDARAKLEVAEEQEASG